jgi:hypothetical protein
MSYAEKAKETYGTACEWIGCGWNQGTCDTHHIDYQEHQEIEDALRFFLRKNNIESFLAFEKEAVEKGYGRFDKEDNQLSKNDAKENLAVLCPNHHRYVHTNDLGMKLLWYIPKRIEE